MAPGGKEINAILPNIIQVKITIINEESIMLIQLTLSLFIRITQNKNEPIKKPNWFMRVGNKAIKKIKIKKLKNSLFIKDVFMNVFCFL